MLSEDDYKEAAALLDCDIPSIRAVAQVESSGHGFLPDGRPKILFERHIFHRLTQGKFDDDHPDISNREPGGYGEEGDFQHLRLDIACHLDREAGLKSASWGRFQIMGFNHRQAGFPTVQEFVNAMYRSEQDHLTAFVNFLRSQGYQNYLRKHNWEAFARAYNGPGNKASRYPERLAEAYKKFKAQYTSPPKST